MRELSIPRRRILATASILLAFAVFLPAFPIMAQAGQSQSRLLASLSSRLEARLRGSFTCSPVYPAPGQAVQFTDTSSGSPASWQWDLGDGTTSTVQNPSHSFAAAGFYRVVLTVGNGSGTRSVRRSIAVVNTSAFAASFAYNPVYPAPGQTVQFTDTSSGSPTSWQWDFGDGTTSTAQNPSHVFKSNGFYRVALAAGNGSGTKSVRRTITVAGSPTLAAAFAFNPASSAVGQAVQFTDTSTGGPTSWQWSFGDGTTSTTQNPSHTYTTTGSKTVTLTVTNNSGSNSVSRTVTVVAALTASFSFTPASPAVGQAVQFTDTSTGGPTSWQWSFGDGTTSTTRNPSHAYTTTGTKTVTLTVTNNSGSNSVSRTVTVVAALTASFSFTPASPAVGQAVQFTDTSTGSPISWLWNFNDRSTSTAQNPSHSFTLSGSYAVTLTVSGSAGSTSITQVINVSPSSTLTASFSFSPASPRVGQAVQFTDTSAGSPTSWQWSFGDGMSSAIHNPSHVYATLGSKTVTLTVTNSTGSSSMNRTITVVASSAIIVNHSNIKLDSIPTTWIEQAKQTLHIAYGHTSHGSQLTTGMTGLVLWKGILYAWNNGGTGGALDLRDYNGNFGNLGIANDLGNPNRTAWEQATRTYLNQNPTVNVIIWSWCWQVDGTQADIQLYLDLMDGLERDYPNVNFVFMTGHTDGAPLTGNVPARNKQIRDYCLAHNKILYDFADIESYNPDGVYFGDKLVNDACDYDSNGDGVRDRNWAVDWQNAHPGEWYNCSSAHSQPLNANMKAYAAWHLWARLAGWDGN